MNHYPYSLSPVNAISACSTRLCLWYKHLDLFFSSFHSAQAQASRRTGFPLFLLHEAVIRKTRLPHKFFQYLLHPTFNHRLPDISEAINPVKQVLTGVFYTAYCKKCPHYGDVAGKDLFISLKS